MSQVRAARIKGESRLVCEGVQPILPAPISASSATIFAMPAPTAPAEPSNRLRTRLFRVLLIGMLWGLLISITFEAVALYEVMARTLVVSLSAFAVFELLARWPRRLPAWLARWALQVAGVAAAIPISTLAVYLVVSQHDPLPLWQTPPRLFGMATISVTGLLVGPWIAVTALMREIRGEAERLALNLELQRSEHQRANLNARLQQLSLQIKPHFLFNTLANIRELVESGSPQAPAVLNSLIAYLRGAVPRLDRAESTIEEELSLVRAYLEVMQMRIPDRLEFSIQVEQACQTLPCPPMALLTLVENAVRHGIDPSEAGGRIDVMVQLDGGRVAIDVVDTGLGINPADAAPSGTGLTNLRQRLELAFGAAAELKLQPGVPQGTRAQLRWPMQVAA